VSDRYALLLSPGAKRALAKRLSVKVATAVWELINGSLRDTPRRVGRHLNPPFAGVWSARRSTYRVLYRIDEDRHTVVILTIVGRPDAYRSL
jgi:mRNA interferase RelE/StbE